MPLWHDRNDLLLSHHNELLLSICLVFTFNFAEFSISGRLYVDGGGTECFICVYAYY